MAAHVETSNKTLINQLGAADQLLKLLLHSISLCFQAGMIFRGHPHLLQAAVKQGLLPVLLGLQRQHASSLACVLPAAGRAQNTKDAGSSSTHVCDTQTPVFTNRHTIQVQLAISLLYAKHRA